MGEVLRIYPNNPEEKFLEKVASQLNKADPNAAEIPTASQARIEQAHQLAWTQGDFVSQAAEPALTNSMDA